MIRIYLAGPMTGIADLNYPLFNREAERLRALGYEVENPAENKEPPCGSWEGYMRLGIGQLVTCDTIANLPDWQDSRGARMENQIAEQLGIKIVDAFSVATPVRN